MEEYRDYRDIEDIVVDVAQNINEKTFLTLCQAYMMKNMIKDISIELVPPPRDSVTKQCYIRYSIEPFFKDRYIRP